MSSPSEPAPAEPTAVDVDPLMAAALTINAAVVRSLASVDASVSVAQLRVLVLLAAEKRLNLSSIARRLGVNPSNASRTCDRLVKAELIHRTEDPADRRHIALSLAPEGEKLLDVVMQRRRAILAEVVAGMAHADQHQLMALLERFNAAAEATGRHALAAS